MKVKYQTLLFLESAMPVTLLEDILRRIFFFIQDTDAQRLSRSVAVGTIVSRVSSQWRTIAFNDSSLWTDIFIGPASPPGTTRMVLERSAKHPLRVLFCISDHTEGLEFTKFSPSFTTSMHLVMAQSTRWCSLSVCAPYLPLLSISKMLSEIPLPQIQSLELIRSDLAALLRCGPFMLDSVSLQNLVLDGVVIRPVHASQFSNLRSLSIANTDSQMLDEVRMRSVTSATIPTQLAPSMTSICNLSISATFLAYVPCVLSVDPSTLVSLKLNGLSAEDFPLHGTPISLIQKLLTENLRSLELTDIDSVTATLFFSSLRGRRLVGLHTLKIMPEVQGLEPLIQSIFPNLVDF